MRISEIDLELWTHHSVDVLGVVLGHGMSCGGPN